MANTLSTRDSVWSALEHLDSPPSYPSLSPLASYASSGEIPLLLPAVDIPSHSLFDSLRSVHTFGPTCLVFGLADDDDDEEREDISPPYTPERGVIRVDEDDNIKPRALSLLRLSLSRLSTESDLQVPLLSPSVTMSTLPSAVFAPSSTLHSETSSARSPVSNAFVDASTPVQQQARPFTPKLRKAVSSLITHAHRQSISPPSSPHPPGLGTSSPQDARRLSKLFSRRSSGEHKHHFLATPLSQQMSLPPSLQPPEITLSTLPSVSSVDEWRFAGLPVALCWLKHLHVELFIDQEAFRAVRPAFVLAGYKYDGPVLPPGTVPTMADHLLHGRADFMPVHREAFVFHDAPLDAPPVLRRVCVGKDESVDYVSREARLPLKGTGPYTVRGSEPAHSHSHQHHGHRHSSFLHYSSHASSSSVVDYTWQFDYLVDVRRRADGEPWRVEGGEKTLAPLLFMCAPGLLQQTHGKKVRLVHVVRKSVTGKLAAEKLAPPIPTRLTPKKASLLHPSPLTRRVRDENGDENTGNTSPYAGHRRSHSHAHPTQAYSATKVSTALSPSASVQMPLRTPMRELTNELATRAVVAKKSEPLIAQNIIPKELLAALFDAHQSDSPQPVSMKVKSVRPSLQRASMAYGV